MSNGGGGDFGIPSPPGGGMASSMTQHAGGLPMAPSLGGPSPPPTMSNGNHAQPGPMMTTTMMPQQQQHGQMMMPPQQQGQSTSMMMTMPPQHGVPQSNQPMQFPQQPQQGTISGMPHQTLQQQPAKLEPPMSPQGNPFDFY